MTTIKIKPSHPSQGEFVLIEKKDFDPTKHELLEGETLGGDTSDGAPTLTELLAGREQLLARKDQLDDLELLLSQRSNDQTERDQALAAREDAVALRENANEIEALRLRDEAARLQAAKDAAAADTVSTAPPPAATATSTDKPTKAAKA